MSDTGTDTPVEIAALAFSNGSETVVEEAGTKVWAEKSMLTITGTMSVIV